CQGDQRGGGAEHFSRCRKDHEGQQQREYRHGGARREKHLLGVIRIKKDAAVLKVDAKGFTARHWWDTRPQGKEGQCTHIFSQGGMGGTGGKVARRQVKVAGEQVVGFVG